MGMPMEEQARKKLQVTIEYDKRTAKGVTGRATKQFPTMQAAKSFYTAKYKDGLNPKVIRAES